MQRASVETEAVRRGWADLLWLEDKGISGGSTVNRPSLRTALDLLAEGKADVLIASKVDRLSRSVNDFADLLTTAQRQGWNLVVLDLGVDLSTPMGRAMAQMAAVFAELERSMIGQRTREALAEKRSQGVQLGRPASTPADVIARVLDERSTGATLHAIATRLNDDGVPTARGAAVWKPQTIAALLRRHSPATV